jgi:sugar phosphate permease
MRRALLLAVIFITYSLAYLDRANFAFGAAAGLGATLHITHAREALLAALFFLGYTFFQLPGMLLARRISATKLIFISLALWGVLATATGLINNFFWLAVDRFLLGIAESIIFPAMLLLLTHWFTRWQRSRANVVLMLGNPVTVLWMSAITGFLIQHFGWQRTFVYEGLPALVWSVVWIAIVRDHPHQAAWLPKEEALALEAQIAAEQAESEANLPVRYLDHLASLRETLLQRDVLLLAAVYSTWAIGLYGFILWLPSIIQQSAGVSIGKTGLLTAVPYAAAIAAELLASHLADRSRHPERLIFPPLLIAGLAMLATWFAAPHSFALALLFLLIACGGMYAPFAPFYAFLPERIGHARRGEVFAFINSVGAFGSFLGSYIVGLLKAFTGSNQAGFLFMAAMLLLSALLFLPILRSQKTFSPAS